MPSPLTSLTTVPLITTGRPVAILRPPPARALIGGTRCRYDGTQCHEREILMGEQVTVPAAADLDETEPLTTEELLVEEVSIDGMCGVY